jgi:diguanylate cyclase (GGDEF)-like protein
MVRVSRKKLLKDGWLAFVEKEDYENVRRTWENSLTNNLEFFANFRMLRGRTSSVWVQCYSSVETDPETREKHHILTFYNIDFLKRKEKKLKELSYKDDLTDLPNRRYLNEFLNHALFDAQRNHRKFTFLYIDLDYFKIVNDTLGHSAGDELLVVVGKRFKNILRGEDFIARVGGDEFCMILYEASTEQSVTAMIERMQNALASPIQISGKEIAVTVSVGAVIYNGERISADELIDRADNALYRAKSSGRNNAKFYFD